MPQIFREKVADISLDQIQIVQYGALWRESILPREKQWNVAETWVRSSGGSQYDAVASGARGLKLLFFFLEIRGMLGGRSSRL